MEYQKNGLQKLMFQMYHYELNLNKVKSLDDCKKILHFLCRHILKPIRGDLTYGGFSEVEEYFEADEI